MRPRGVCLADGYSRALFVVWMSRDGRASHGSTSPDPRLCPGRTPAAERAAGLPEARDRAGPTGV